MGAPSLLTSAPTKAGRRPRGASVVQKSLCLSRACGTGAGYVKNEAWDVSGRLCFPQTCLGLLNFSDMRAQLRTTCVTISEHEGCLLYNAFTELVRCRTGYNRAVRKTNTTHRHTHTQVPAFFCTLTTDAASCSLCTDYMLFYFSHSHAGDGGGWQEIWLHDSPLCRILLHTAALHCC